MNKFIYNAISTVLCSTLLACQPVSNDNTGAISQQSQVSKKHDTLASSLAPYQQRDIKNEVFYFVLPDRFYNGNRQNDLGADKNDQKRALSRGGFDPSNKGMYHGGDIAGIIDKLPYLDQLGVSAIWLTPLFRNQAVQASTAGYHGYWILDFTEVDPHFGTNDELKKLIELAHQRNIKVFFDIIANHTADVIKYKECHGEDGLGWLVKGDNGCPYISTEQLAKGEHYSPLIVKGNENVKKPDWLNDPKYYHNQGDSFWQGESAVNGDFAGLDDLNTEDPAVVDGMIKIYQNVIKQFKPDGFRIDTVKHVNLEFWQQFSPAMLKTAQQLGIKNFFMFGEVYSADPQFLSQFTTTGKLQSVLDFGLQNAIEKTLVEQQGTNVLSELFQQDNAYQDNDSSANELVNFISNHDMGRFSYFLEKSPFNYSEQEKISRLTLASALMFFSRGVPVIYYGDEQGFVGDGNDQDSRQDMMPSKVATYNDDDLLATNKTTADDNFDTTHPLYQQMAKQAQLFHQYSALQTGKQQVVLSDKSPGLFAITRQQLSDKTEDVLVVFNTSTEVKTLPKALSEKISSAIYFSQPRAKTQSGSTNLATISPLSYALFSLK